MYDPYHERLMSSDDSFKSQEEYQCFNVSSASNEEQPLLSVSRLRHDDNDKWIQWLAPAPVPETPHIAKYELKVLALRPSSLEASYKHQLMCSRHIWEAVEDAWKLPNSVFKSLIGGGAGPFLHRYYQVQEPTKMGVTIVQKGLRIWLSITAVYQVSSRTSLVIINSGKRGISDRILADFQRCLSEAWIPALLPVLVIENIMSEYEREIRGSFERLNRVRSAIGISPYSTTRASDELDLLQQSVELTYLAQLFAAMDNQLSTLAANVATVARFHESFCTSLRSLAIDAKQEAILEIHERLEHAKRHVQTRLEWNVCRVVEVQASVQTVYSMIGNRDNILNFRAAQASVRIAELARKDSSDMRIIAAVTLLFLPATFVATLFSTSFFNFQPDNTGKHVSSLYWLYWVVTVSLTLVIGLAWFWSSRVTKENSVPHLETLDRMEK